MTSKGAFIRIGSSTKITIKCSANNVTDAKTINRKQGIFDLYKEKE